MILNVNSWATLEIKTMFVYYKAHQMMLWDIFKLNYLKENRWIIGPVVRIKHLKCKYYNMYKAIEEHERNINELHNKQVEGQ